MSHGPYVAKYMVGIVMLVLISALAGLSVPSGSAPGTDSAGMRIEKEGWMAASRGKREIVKLPAPPEKGAVSVEEAIWRRRSIRDFTKERLSPETVSTLLWAAQGITDEGAELRAAPSAGATYPLELYCATAEYVARYLPGRHCLEVTKRGDVRSQLAGAALYQSWVEEAPAVFVFVADPPRTAIRYGERATLYIHIEVGCASENLMLQAAAMGLGSVPVGAFEEDEVAEVLDLPKGWIPYLIVPVGVPAGREE
ncbi:MAG: SagB/ThcOx family dehydrogenase [bacterium]|nr:MAG: SagB/ThcOx family dehydrogenase [bacterium]